MLEAVTGLLLRLHLFYFSWLGVNILQEIALRQTGHKIQSKKMGGMLLVCDFGRADVGNGSGGEKTDVGHSSESASWTYNDLVNTFHGRSRPSW